MSTVTKTAEMLMAQLDRLNKLTVAGGERLEEQVDAIKAECDRAKAVNDTARNVIALGDLYLRAEMLQMTTPERKFVPGPMFAQPQMVDVNKPNLLRQTANAWGEESQTVINRFGEFETDDGLDDYYARVCNKHEKAPDHEGCEGDE